MSSTQTSPEHPTGLPLRFGISIGVVSLVVAIIVASYVCNYKRLLQNPAARNTNTPSLDDQDSVVGDTELGSVIDINLPRLQFSQAKLEKVDSVGTCCAICLVDYKDEDWLWQLPDCGHLFHVDCVGCWLRLHGTCPVCRSSLRSTTVSAPVAQRFWFIPFAR